MNDLKIWSVNILGVGITFSHANEVIGFFSVCAALIYSCYGIAVKRQEYKRNKKK